MARTCITYSLLSDVTFFVSRRCEVVLKAEREEYAQLIVLRTTVQAEAKRGLK